jgi:hypothetical protein
MSSRVSPSGSFKKAMLMGDLSKTGPASFRTQAAEGLQKPRAAHPGRPLEPTGLANAIIAGDAPGERVGTQTKGALPPDPFSSVTLFRDCGHGIGSSR